MFRGFTESIKIMRKIKPNIVVGMGSYVCVPVILASSCLNVPTLIHEQNLLPGRANRLLGYIVDKIAISFEG